MSEAKPCDLALSERIKILRFYVPQPTVEIIPNHYLAFDDMISSILLLAYSLNNSLYSESLKL